MIEKPKRQKQLNNQDRQLPSNIQELINRYDLDNTKIYEFLDDVVEYFSPIDIEGNNVAIGQKYDTSEGSKLQVNGDISLTNRANRININGHKGIIRHWTNDTQISANDGVIYLRPKGDENATNQVIIGNDGNTNITKTSGFSGYIAKRSDTGVEVWLGVGESGENHGIYSKKLGKWIVYADKFNAYLDGRANRGTLSDKLESINGRITDANVAHTYENDKAHVQLLLATSQMTSNKPVADGYILHFSWDNSGQHEGQLYIPNSTTGNPSVQFRGCAGGTWGNWENLYRAKSLYDNSSGTTGTVTLSETSANFAYLEIFLTKDTSSGMWSVKVPAPNGKSVQVGTTYNYGTGLQLIGKTVAINGTAITQKEERYQNITSGTTPALSNAGTQTSIKITKVVGYR